LPLPSQEPTFSADRHVQLVPDATGLQAPWLPATLQAWHAVPQAESQQKPSAQCLFAHSASVAQGEPLGRAATQAPPAQ
jgi:hypothetical protein